MISGTMPFSAVPSRPVTILCSVKATGTAGGAGKTEDGMAMEQKGPWAGGPYVWRASGGCARSGGHRPDLAGQAGGGGVGPSGGGDRESTRLNSSHSQNSYAGFCLKKKKKTLIVHFFVDSGDSGQ